jgi:Lar family restriction alleviation protein
MESDIIELKPCPFCGSDNLYISDSVYQEGCVIGCIDCGSEVGNFDTKEEVVERWNHREDKKVSELLGMLEIERVFGLSVGVSKLVQELSKTYYPEDI